MIDENKPFILHGNLSVQYIGRASSKLIDDDYVIIRKKDGSLLIHGSLKSKPLNYQSSGASIKYQDNEIISIRRNETIKIHINKIYFYNVIENWSHNEISIINTENDLVDKFIDNMDDYFDNVEQYCKEYKTDYGSIDLLIVNNVYNILEFKRGKINLSGCTQLLRYIECFKDKDCFGYMVAPEISKNALKYLKTHNCEFIKYDFE